MSPSSSRRSLPLLIAIVALCLLAAWFLRSSDPTAGNRPTGGLTVQAAADTTGNGGPAGHGYAAGGRSGAAPSAADRAAYSAASARRAQALQPNPGTLPHALTGTNPTLAMADLGPGAGPNRGGQPNGGGNGFANDGGGSGMVNGGTGQPRMGRRTDNPARGGGKGGSPAFGTPTDRPSGMISGYPGKPAVPDRSNPNPPKPTPPAPPGSPLPGQPDPDVVPDHYVIAFKDTVKDPEREAKLFAKMGIRIDHVYTTVFKGFGGHIPPHILPAVLRDPRVDEVEAQHIYRTTAMPGEFVPEGIQRVRAQLSPTVRFNPNGISLTGIAILDTGIDRFHPDLNHYYGRSLVPWEPFIEDFDGHGTHVAGTAAAVDAGFGIVGVAPGARLYNIKVLDSGGVGTLATVLAGVDFTGRLGGEGTTPGPVMVANMSLGGAWSGILNRAVNRLWDRGVVPVVAAGNSGDIADRYSPASARKAICVAAMCDTDGFRGGFGPMGSDGTFDDEMPVWSNRGRRIKIIAPGVDVLSTYPFFPFLDYEYLSGTSMACPHCAGAVAVMLADPMLRPNPKVRDIVRGPDKRPKDADAVLDKLRDPINEWIPGVPGDPLIYPMLRVDKF